MLTNLYDVRIQMKHKDMENGARVWSAEVVAAAPHDYLEHTLVENMGGQAVGKCDKDGAVMPTLFSNVECDDAAGVLLVGNEIASSVALYVTVARDLEMQHDGSVCEISGEINVMKTLQEWTTMTVKMNCEVDRAFAMNLKKGQHAIMFVSFIDTQANEAFASSVHVLTAPSADVLEKVRYGFFEIAQRCAKLLDEAQKATIDAMPTEQNGMYESALLAQLRTSPNTKVTTSFATPAKTKNRDTSTKAKSSAGEEPARKRMRKALSETDDF
jgi:hypothetical protein